MSTLYHFQDPRQIPSFRSRYDLPLTDEQIADLAKLPHGESTTIAISFGSIKKPIAFVHDEPFN